MNYFLSTAKESSKESRAYAAGGYRSLFEATNTRYRTSRLERVTRSNGGGPTSLSAQKFGVGLIAFGRSIMPDALKKFLAHELDELRRNKISTIALGACLVVLLVFWLVDDTSGGEEINLNEPAVADKPVTKDLPAKPLPVTKSPDGVTLVLGANADPLTIDDPFAGNEKPKPPPTPKPAAKLPPIAIQPPTTPPSAPQEKILLTGTAISGERKTAMFLRGKDTLFLTIGEEIAGRRIVDINPDFVTFADGGRVFVQKELN